MTLHSAYATFADCCSWIRNRRLREEIHEQLKHRKEVKTFVNQYHPAYGYGATEIFFEY